ncbi:MAG: hypothetical protein JWR01_2437, partial [Subtercola sp.]|nr:hypothetical protein [Subtercola sp.]
PASLGGTYTMMRVWAIAADGTSSWPFYVAIRNRYAPTARVVSTTEAIRGVDTVIPQSRLFADVDVDDFPAASGDHLESTVTAQGEFGGAWFDAAGDLHYRSIDVIHGEATDHVSVTTTDRFGLTSPTLTVTVHISDVTPGCANGGASTDANTPLRIRLDCWITAPAGWSQIEGLRYRIDSPPEFGRLSDLDPVAGTATYTPDAVHPGPVGFTFTATNNGAERSAQFALQVLAVPDL